MVHVSSVVIKQKNEYKYSPWPQLDRKRLYGFQGQYGHDDEEKIPNLAEN
jgi:hypothetical protein